MDRELIGTPDRTWTAEVGDGALRVAEWGPAEAQPVLAVHGIGASSRAWLALARRLPDLRLIAPDLRGRAGSAGLPARYGLRQHVADLRALLDALSLPSGAALPVVGHSMGAFVTLLLADAEPDRVERALLIDGGIPLLPPDGVPLEQLLAAGPAQLLGAAWDRLTRVFPDADAVVDFWRVHPAFAGDFTADIEAYARYDLEEVDGGVRAATVPDAVAADQRELFGPEWFTAALRRVRQPVTVLRAPLGLQAEPPGLYAPGRLKRDGRALVPQLEVVEVAALNHYTVLMTEPGASVVERALRTGLDRDRPHPTH